MKIYTNTMRFAGLSAIVLAAGLSALPALAQVVPPPISDPELSNPAGRAPGVPELRLAQDPAPQPQMPLGLGPRPGFGPAVATEEAPTLTDNTNMTPEMIEGFNAAIEQAFPMTPEMIQRYREIFEESQRAILERPEPQAMITTDLVSLEPGAPPPLLNVAPGVASVVTFMDAAGAPWPISRYVIGNADIFQVISLGEGSNALTVTPTSRVGTTNLVVALQDSTTPVVMRIVITETRAHFRHDIQVADLGPNTDPMITAVPDFNAPRAGNDLLLAALSGVDLPRGARPIRVEGVQADAWEIDGEMYIRSRHNLISPSWTGSMAGPGGYRVYRIASSNVLLFSVDGRIVRARTSF